MTDRMLRYAPSVPGVPTQRRSDQTPDTKAFTTRSSRYKSMDAGAFMQGADRGYYSELATDREYKPEERYTPGHRRPAYLWELTTYRHTPTVRDWKPDVIHKIVAPAERWMCFEEEKTISFPVDVFKPKVQLKYDMEPYKIPRNVAIERRRRLYEKQNWQMCLKAMRITPEQILPVDVLDREWTGIKFGLYNMIHWLPLEWFDDEEFSTKTPEGWLNHGVIDGIAHPVPAIGFVPVPEPEKIPKDDRINRVYNWINIAVLDYNSHTQKYKILTLDGFKRMMHLPEIYILFGAEEPMQCARRLRAAVDLREEAERIIRWEYVLDSQVLFGIYEIPETWLDKIKMLSYRGKGRGRLFNLPNVLNNLIDEIQLNHKRTLGALEFRWSVNKQPDQYKFIVVPPIKEEKIKEKGAVDSVVTRYEAKRAYYAWYTIYVLPNSLNAMQQVVMECLKVQQMLLFTMNYGKLVTLDEFETLQNKFTSHVMKYLKYTWIDITAFNLRMCISDCGKGWFDITQSVHSIYDIAKLSRLFQCVKYRMQYSLRIIIESSIQAYTNLIETPCQMCQDVADDFEWEGNLIESPFTPKVAAIFSLVLRLSENCAFYSTDPDVFERTLLKLYDQAIVSTHTIKQIHPNVLSKLHFASDLYLTSVGLLEACVCDLRERFIRGYQQAIIPLKAYARKYHTYLEFFNLNVNTYLQQYKDEQHGAAEVKEEVNYHFRMKENLEATVPGLIVIGPFSVNTDSVKQILITKRLDIVKKLLDQFAERMKILFAEIIDEYKFIQIRLSERPNSIEHIYDIRDWMETIPLTVRGLDETTKRLNLEYEILDAFWYNLPQEDFDQKWEAVGWPLKISKYIDETNEILLEETEKFLKIQMQDESNLQEKIEALIVQVAGMYQLCDASKCNDIAIEMKRVWKVIKEAQEQGQLLNSRQRLFLLPVVPFDALTKLMKEFEPYKNMWTTAADWLHWHEIWMDNPLSQIDGEGIDILVSDMFKTMTKSNRIFSDFPRVQSVAITIRDQIEQFKPLIPIIQALRNPGMRDRHWEQFVIDTNLDIPWGPATTFKQCIEFGIASFAEDMVRISENASKEYAIEQALDKMAAEWEENLLELTLYKKTGTFIMKVSDDIQQMLDDHIVMTQQLSFSPFKAALSDRIDEWDTALRVTYEVIEEWIDVQRQWMYLEPIFASDDISKQLPVETKKYLSMERTWKRIMRSAYDKPKIIEYCPDKKLLESLKDANHILEVVQKGLADYLEMKRSVFPRLYFLSDDELLEILSQARNPLAVQPHLRKCFENIAKLNFEEDLKITKMYSSEGECVDLDPTTYPTGNVEQWLLVVEQIMKNTVRMILGKSLQTVKTKDRKLWVLEWPGQVVIAGCQTYWTAGIEENLVTNNLAKFFQIVLRNLDSLRALVKGRLTYLQREVLSALIVIEVHARDVTQILVDNKVSNVNDFDWISQLRYYWVGEEMKVRAVNAEFQYGYEYLGNSGRLVITPLTDRCYLTLTGALHLKFGGAPAGPAGTGKTETTKDLAKAMAIQCVVFNCSDQLDFIYMGKFFKGLASSGAWACFDEFNRIDIEVLSVIAQQIMTIQKAQQARLDRFVFEGCEIALRTSCAVFITMNPGYAGRTELPDNLKALFRPVAMMVPNYTLIAEISLFSFGFGNAKPLANKITTTFKLSSEQLSTQDHYDFGMRAVKTVIAVAGNLKREKPNMDERQIALRAIRDVNVPKFLKDDLKLFNGIVSDLFPKMVEEVVDYGALELSIRACLLEQGLEDVDDYVKKVIQLYETTVVRHGLMLVGPTGSGKTCCYVTLQRAMTILSEKGKLTPAGSPFCRVFTYVLNPKSITMGQLYGEFDLQTHEWTDGILPSLVRIGVAATSDDKCWYVFDGPVDAVWIENMNSVLDDNKKLCLSSGEIIKLRDTQTMIFEVADLAVASPATVSRCGMVYLEPGVLGLEPYVNCWLERIPPMATDFTETLRELINYYVFPALEFVRNHLREVLASIDSAVVTTFLHMMDFRLLPLTGKDNRPPPPPQFVKLIPDLLIPWVVFSVIWTLGGTCDNDGRIKFSRWMRDKMTESKHKPYFPEDGLVYDYKLHDGGFTDTTDDGNPKPPTWRLWMQGIEEFRITVDMKYSDIEIPTIDNVRNSELIGMILLNEKNVLCVGPTGTGKTLTIMRKLSQNMHKKFICDFVNFSARTSSNQTQDLIDSKLDRRRKGVFGPPVMKRQIFFIDDFNMPALEVFGAQPPIELIRQWMDFSGWYDRRNIGEFRYIIDVNFAAAMGPPGGGRNPITQRLLRHFHYLTFLEFEDVSKREIFGKILNFWIKRSQFEDFFSTILNTSLKIFNTIIVELLPTPAKTHYTFNLRDLSKVFQGLLMFDPETLTSMQQMIRLWYHENCRVYQDRLVNDEDRHWFDQLLKEKIKGFGYSVQDCLGGDILFYGDFLDASSDIRPYIQIVNIDVLFKVLNNYLDEYNANTTSPMKLVLFLDAMQHVCRISRIIRQPMGNALLLGMGGSGRQSLTRLSAHLSEFACFQIELSKAYGPTEWREDVKNLMLRAGLQARETVFLFSDTQIKTELFLEDLNNILNSGDVPNCYPPEDMDKIYQGMKGLLTEMGLTATKSNLFAVYQRQVRMNLHTVISMSPIGEIFRARLRQFPALVNCCTIDWFSPWPDSALQSVAKQYLEDIPDLNVSKAILDGIVNVCQFMHASVVTASEQFLAELSRHNYVTPTSYLQLLSSYTDLMNKKKGGLTQGVGRLKTGLFKLQNTSEEVKHLQKQLTLMKPALEVAARDAEIMITQIAADTLIAEETKSVVEKEEMAATKKAIETQAIAEDAERDLEEALPALLAAEKSLQALNKNDITEVRAMKRPPVGVIYVIEAICIVKGVKPVKIPGEKPGEKLLDYWEPGRGMLSDPGAFLMSLMNFDKDSITDEMIQKLEKYVSNPNFQPAKIVKVSKACTSLCMWAHAMYKYYFVNLGVAPKKAALKAAKEDLALTEAALAKSRAEMKKVMDGLEVLNEKLQTKIAFKAEKEASINMCQERMNRAVRLIGGLADERVRWIQTIANIEANTVNVTGDILICSGAVAYLTPFTDSYRKDLFTKWLTLLTSLKVPHSEKCDPVSILGEPVVIRSWQIDGLPRDALSTENAVLVSCSKRWPLFIDPQGQANKWIKNMAKPRGLAICKLSDKDLIRTLELAIRFGKPVLIENVATELDPSIDPVLLRSLFKQSGTWMLKLGDSIVPYNDDFQLYITTKLRNPHYTPEISIKVQLVNFTVVPTGLLDQLLALVVMQERPDLEEQRSQIVISSAQMKQELKEIEDRILMKLSTSEGSPLDDIDFITTLEASKVKSEDIKSKVEAAEITQIDIDNTRMQYVPVANRGQILFFCVADLSNVDPMYQYSLEWFISIFINSMAETEKTENLNERVQIINDYFTYNLYANVCRSLFAKDNLLFAFLLCVRIMMNDNLIDAREWHMFLAGGSPPVDLANPCSKWLTEKAWKEVLSLKALPRFGRFVDTFALHEWHYRTIFESTQPHRENIPDDLKSDIDDFRRLIVIKSLRPDKITNAMQDFLTSNMGQQYVEPITSDLSAMYKESASTIPLIFVLSTGTDPAADLFKFADKMKMTKRTFAISLGQGQGPRAEQLIHEGAELGNWVFFQNCHLAPSFMPRLERVIDEIEPDMAHKEFRIWLTSTPSPAFPVAILQNGSKMTVEPPRGLKANMLRAYSNQVTDLYDFFHSEHPKVFTFKWLLFSLCVFHGCLLERRKFGPLGFNIPYEFTDGDLKISISQLYMFLLEYSDVPFKVLVYTAGHINYGGRVTDDWDRRCLMNILADYYKPEVLNSTYVFDNAGFYHQIDGDTSLIDYMDYMKTFPLNDDPSLFGLHDNADITCAQAQAYLTLATLLTLQPKEVGGSAGNQEEDTAKQAKAILAQIPALFDVDGILEAYPVMYEESLNTVIVQEAIRYNRLLKVIETSLKDLLKALKGLVVMSEALELMSGSLFQNAVPDMWASKAYPSLMPLGAWVDDLNQRVRFLVNWVNNGIPPAFWISGFYFPQAFLTGTLQNYARKYVVSIDTIGFAFTVLDRRPAYRPADGCAIYGLYLEGCRWSTVSRLLDESRPKELYTEMVPIWLVPEENHVKPDGMYECPVYKTLKRAGVLSTTGHSTNYVIACEIPTDKPEKHWIKRGVALFCALDY